LNLKAIRGPIVIVAVLAALGGATSAAAAPLPDDLQTDGPFAGFAVPPAQSRAASEFWTPERLARAKPLDSDSVELGDAGDSPLAKPMPAPVVSTPVDPKGYPNRVHGKIFMQFPNAQPGFYSCSGTIVTSGSGSLVNTAAHCVFDFHSKSLATGMVFIPGYGAGSIPYSVWPVTNFVINKRWVQRQNSYDIDSAMLRVAPVFGVIQNLGSRGIGFNQPRRQRIQEYGYPAEGKPTYDGNSLIRCDSGYINELRGYGGPRGMGIHCDAGGGTSGGGWVAQRSFLVSNSSHNYPQYSRNQLFGPYFGSKVKALYKASTSFFPSIGPIRCGGEVASIVGTNFKDKIRGTNGRDVIATVDGRDRVNGRGGRDVICGGGGSDKLKGGGGRDQVEGGDGRDNCGRKRGDKHHGCE
jgi:V8-like Glu-specific endopeptidase